ncbi:hypothetical protein [Streptomyces sp. NPDC048669]|uniref:hypothetical protein n=1 Tax=Streptomyces sp. NPDC048669 TaxID=3155267 RepID=UPI003423BB8E
MTEPRIPLGDLTSDQLDHLYERLARADRATRRAEGSESWMAKGLAKQRHRAEQAEAAIEHVRAVAAEWGEPNHCGWLSASVLVRQLRAALDQAQQPTI